MKSDAFGLRAEVISRLREIFQARAGVERVMLYGSRARGDHRASSDIDLAIVGPSLKSSDLSALENQIDDLLLPYQVDLCLLHEIRDANFLKQIDAQAVEFFRRDE